MFGIRKKKRSPEKNRTPEKKQEQPKQDSQTLSSDLDYNVNHFKNLYANCTDFVFRSFLIGGVQKAVLMYLDGLSNTEEMNENLLATLLQAEQTQNESSIREMIEKLMPISKIHTFQTFQEGIQYISAGNPLLLIDGETQGMALGLDKWEKRAVEEPTEEVVLRGPREGFTESLQVNSAMLRRRLRTPDFKLKAFQIGTYTQTNVLLAYIEGLANPELIQEAEKRLQRIEIDGILASNYIEELIVDHPGSIFPQLLTTERSDVVAAGLLEGRFAILIDGTPFALVAPITFFSLLQSAEDFYQNYWVSSALRWLRYLFTFMSLTLPSLYVAALTFHQEMVPTTLLISIAQARESVPFPALIEALLMEVTFEALREAGLRLPRQVGPAVSIVGTLVIGQAAVQAGLVSSHMIMIVAMTGISSFMIPRYTVGVTFRLLRFPMILAAGTFGLLGIVLVLIMMVVHLSSLRSFGVSYLSPFVPLSGAEIKDTIFRAPLWSLNTRPRLNGTDNPYRQAPNQKPGPPQEREQKGKE
jgi:hypothetical protein